MSSLLFYEIDSNDRIGAGELGELHDIETDTADAEDDDRLADLHACVVVDDAGRGRHRAAEQRGDLQIVVGGITVMRFSEITAYSLKVVTQPALSFSPRHV